MATEVVLHRTVRPDRTLVCDKTKVLIVSNSIPRVEL